MGCKTIPEQLAVALGKDTIANTDQFPVVVDDTLYRVTIGDLATSLGLTGAITSAAGANATPVLTGTAPDYVIRGIVGAQGITTSVNAFGSISVAGQVKDAGSTADGVGIIKNRTANTLEWRRLQAGAGITLEQNTNSITISNDQVAPDSNTVVVNELSDFPDPVGGVITLADNKSYFIANNISTSNRFVFGANCVITASDPFVTTLTYTGTGTMFSFVNGAAGIRIIDVECPNGTVFDGSAVTAGNLVINFVRMTTVNNLGILGHPSTGIVSLFIINHTGQGFTFSGVSNKRFSMQTSTIINSTSPTANMLDLGSATFSAFNISNIALLSTTAGQSFLKGLASGANLISGVIGYVETVTINGDMVGLDTITTNDAGWDFSGSNKIADTRPVALMTLATPTDTVISTINTPVVVSGTFNDEESSLFNISAAGRVTYIGNRPLATDLTASITFQSASGTNTFEFYLAKNGVPIIASGVSREVTSTTTANISMLWDLPIVENDYLELWVANTTGTNDVSAVKIVARFK